MVYGYKITDGNINYLGASDEQEKLVKALTMANISTSGIQFTNVEPISLNGKYYLSADDEEYIEEKARLDKEQAISQLMSQYEADKLTLMNYFLSAVLDNDTETQEEIREELSDLSATYDSEIEELRGE